MWKGAQKHKGVTWTKERQFDIQQNVFDLRGWGPGTAVHWAITVIRGQNGQAVDLSPESEERAINYQPESCFKR